MQPFYDLIGSLARASEMAVVLSVGRSRYDLQEVAEETIVLAPTFVLYAGPTKGLTAGMRTAAHEPEFGGVNGGARSCRAPLCRL